MDRLPDRFQTLALVVAAGAGIALLSVAALAGGLPAPLAFGLGAVLLLLCSMTYLAAVVDPAWSLSGAVILSCFSGNWYAFGLPGAVAPDRLLLVAGLGALLLRAPSALHRPDLPLRPVHWLMGVAVLYAVASAALAGTLFDTTSMFRLVDRYGIVPFLVFLVAPVAFRTEAQRQILLTAFVVFGAYLGLTAFFERIGPRALVFPRFILDPTVGIHPGRARGPFLEAVSNGFGLYVGATAATIALLTWRGRGRRLAAKAVIGLCVLGILLTVTRSVWVGSAAALLVTMLAARELRRYVLPAVIGVALLIGGLLVSVPAIAGQAERRAGTERTVWERDALNTAAINMYEERPLFGFGWGRYIEISDGYMEQADDYPLIKLTGITVHNVFLSHLSELGLVGLTLWVAILVAAVAGAFTTRGPPELRPWRIGRLGVVVCWLVVAMLVNPLSFPMLILFVWAGVATGLPEPQAEGAAATEPGSLSPRVGAVAAP